MLKEQKGITLVALIITIIVMLILAGVSISLVVGENGVLTQAQEAGSASKRGAAMDAIALGNANFYAGQYETGARKLDNDIETLLGSIKSCYENGDKEVTFSYTEAGTNKTLDSASTSETTIYVAAGADPVANPAVTSMTGTITIDGCDPISVTLTQKAADGIISIKVD